MRRLSLALVVCLVACTRPAPADDPQPVSTPTPVQEPEGDGLVRSVQEPWSLWDGKVGKQFSFRVEFEFLKKLASHRRKAKYSGTLAFRRADDERAMRLDVTRKDGNIDNIVVADAKRFWTFTPGDDSTKPLLETVDLTKRPGLKGALHSLMLFYGSTKIELEKSFSVKTVKGKGKGKSWSFELTPREIEDRKHVRKISVSLEGADLKSVRFDTKPKEYMVFNIRKLDIRKLKESELDFKPPAGTEIKVIKDDSQDDDS